MRPTGVRRRYVSATWQERGGLTWRAVVSDNVCHVAETRLSRHLMRRDTLRRGFCSLVPATWQTAFELHRGGRTLRW
jgi:hypothetical protein